MGLMTSLVRGSAPATETKSIGGFPASGFPSALGSMQTASGMLVSQATSLQVSAVYSCVRIRARDVARCTPSLVRIDEDGNEAKVKNHPLAKLLKRPNRKQSWFEFAEQMGVARLLRGNAYAVKIRNWKHEVVELIPVNPDLVQVLESPNGSIFYNVSRAGMWLMAVLDGHPIAIPEEDVFHVRDLTFNTLVGLSNIGMARDAIGLAMGQEQQASRWMGNGARPAGVLQSAKTLSEDAAKRLKANWESLQQGVQNTGRTAVLEDGVEWKPMQLTAVDVDFINARKMQVREIARFFDVPLHKLQENDQAPKATIAELNADYVQTVVMGDVERWEQRFEVDFNLDDEGLSVNFDESRLLRADTKTMRENARAGVLSGLITQNEGRAEIGYGPRENADSLLAPVNLAPNGSAIDGHAPDGAGRPPVSDGAKS